MAIRRARGIVHRVCVERALIWLPLVAIGCSSEREPSEPAHSGIAVSALLTPAQATAADRLMPRTLALTFDDGPDTSTVALATYLAEEGIPATFFVNGCHLQGSAPPRDPARCPAPGSFDPAILETVVRLGHRVANHTEDHLSLIGLDQADFYDQLERNQSILDPFVHDGFYVFRPPYNDWDATRAAWAASEDHPAVRKLVGPILYDVDGADWNCAQSGLTPDQCIARYLASLDSVPTHNGIVQMHDGNEFARGTDYVLRVVRGFVQAVRQRPEKYRFVALDAIRGLHGASAFLPVADWSTAFTDAAGWNTSPSRYASLRLGDIDGDGRADICGRDGGGIVCARAGANEFGPVARWFSADFLDASGWDDPRYGATVQLADIDGDGAADVCGRGIAGIVCYVSNRTDGFGGIPIEASGFSDAMGWGDAESLWGSIHLADVDGDGRADTCGRRSDGVYCALSQGRAGFAAPTPWLVTDFNDAWGWRPEKYGSTLQFADVNGDGRADVCGRGVLGIYCALSRKGDASFAAATLWTRMMFSDSAGWDDPSRYKSIRLGDIDGDGRADICGRDAHGVVCGISTGAGSFGAFRFVRNDEFRDDVGWGVPSYGATLQLADLDGDGRADLCGRGSHRVACALAQPK